MFKFVTLYCVVGQDGEGKAGAKLGKAVFKNDGMFRPV